MRFILLIFVIFILTGRYVLAQDLEFRGYYENQFFPQEINNKISFQDYNKVRLDISTNLFDRVSFNGDYIYQIYHGRTSFNAFDLIPDRVVSEYASHLQISPGTLRPFFTFGFDDQNFLDNAYISMYLKYANIRIGKQQLPWGSGYTWNPTDIFNEKNLLDPTYEKTGVNAFKIEIPYSTTGLFTGIVSVGEDWENSIKAVKCKDHFSGFDISACFIEKEQESNDYLRLTEFWNTSSNNTPTATAHEISSLVTIREQRRLWGGDFSGELFGLGVWAEGAYNQMEASGNFAQYLLGLDYTFENGLYLMTEIYRNELGEVDKNDYSFNSWMRLLSTQGENLGRDYVFAGNSYLLTDLLNWTNYLIINADDQSGIIFPWFNYSLTDNTEVLLVGYIPFGESETEFGEFGAGGFARIRVYF